jgi:hypothetical protein
MPFRAAPGRLTSGTIAGRLLLGVCLGAIPVAWAQSQTRDTVTQTATLPIRFLQPVTSGRDSVGTKVLVQTLGAVVRDSCVVVPAYTEIVGRVTLSRGGARFGHGGHLALHFDSLQVARGRWVPISGVLDSLEYQPQPSSIDSGNISAPSRRRAHLAESAVPIALAAATGVAIVPAAIVGELTLARRGPRVRILAGEVGRMVFTHPLVLAHPGRCLPVREHRRLYLTPAIPEFMPRTETKKGEPSGDPINLVLLGSLAEVEGAFRAAGWASAHSASLDALAKEVLAAIVSKPGGTAPVSTKYFGGRPQDLSYELPGPTARTRHHLRLWLADTARGIWAGAANQDVGLLVRPLHQPTHRIASDIDAERDLIVLELEAGGCADLLEYVELPGIPATGRNAEGQLFRTDGRTAVIRARRCDAPEPEERNVGG